MLALSLGTASAIGLASAPCDPPPTTAYLLAGGRCSEECLFCAQARSSSARTDALSRVTWPAVDREDALEGLARQALAGQFQRVCVQSTCLPGALEQTCALTQTVASATGLPVCASVLPADDGEVDALIGAGVDIVGFGLDAVTPAVYAAIKQPHLDARAGAGAWQRHFDLVLSTAARHPGRAGAHLIIGLGESERDAIVLIQWLVDQGVIVALFAFTPVRGTAMEHRPPPPIGSYRRIQAARFLITSRHCQAADFAFGADGRLVSFGLRPGIAHELLRDGDAFRTSGCPGCNRPYYNERPGGLMYNYARPLAEDETRRAIADLQIL
jgi:biotin synthase